MNKWIFILALILIVPFVHSDDLVSQQTAQVCLNQSAFYMQDLMGKGFNVLRVNDTLNKAELIYLGQLEKQKKASSELDFELVKEYCDSIENIYDLAIEANDDYFVLRSFYNLSYEDGMNNSESLLLIQEVKQEIDNERYEKVPPLVEEGYQIISDMVKNYSTLNRFYQNATLGIVTFFKSSWKEIVITCWSLFILFLVFKRPVKKWLIKERLKNLQVRKLALEEYFKGVQKNYFDGKGISQRDYLVRGGNYSNFVLEIDRQVAILNEKLEKLEKQDKKEKKVKKKKEAVKKQKQKKKPIKKKSRNK